MQIELPEEEIRLLERDGITQRFRNKIQPINSLIELLKLAGKAGDYKAIGALLKPLTQERDYWDQVENSVQTLLLIAEYAEKNPDKIVRKPR